MQCDQLWALPRQDPLSGAQGGFTSSSRAFGPVGLARERMNLLTVELPEDFFVTTQSARASFTRWAYDGKWHVHKGRRGSFL